MSADEKMLEVVQAYFDLFNADDGAGIAALFADDAKVHDPVGTPPKVGKEEIAAFYDMATRAGTRLERTGPVRIAGNQAAFPISMPRQSDKKRGQGCGCRLTNRPNDDRYH